MKAQFHHKEMVKLLLDHGARKSSIERRAQLAQLRERIRIVENHGSEWATMIENAGKSDEALSLVQSILENSEHPRLTANILLTATQTALDVGIDLNNVDLVVLLLQHGAWPAGKTALARAEANSDLDPRITEALREQLPAAFKIAGSTDLGDTSAKEDVGIEQPPKANHDTSEDLNDKTAVKLADDMSGEATKLVNAAKEIPPLALSMFRSNLRYPYALGLLKTSHQSSTKERRHERTEAEEEID
jgi:ankyrin repeat protein